MGAEGREQSVGAHDEDVGIEISRSQLCRIV